MTTRYRHPIRRAFCHTTLWLLLALAVWALQYLGIIQLVAREY